MTVPPPESSEPPERAADLADWPQLRAALAGLAQDTGRDERRVYRAARGYLHELRTTHGGRIHDGWVRAGRALLARGYERVDYDPAEVERVRSLLASRPAVVLSSHRSYLDGGALTVGFHDHGLPPLTVFGGINMAFWPLGALWRRNGMVFIRRGTDDPVYRCVLRHYLARLVGERRPLQWFIEGTRSRTGKLGPPRLGLLAYLADAFRDGSLEDLQLLPVSVAYDQLQEVSEYAGEARGGAKTTESLGWLLRFVRAQRGHFGSIYVRFGEPLSLREALGSGAAARRAGPEERRLALQKLAFEVSARINGATPVTGAALVTLALLGARGRALTPGQIRLAVAGYLDFAQRRQLPVAPTAVLRSDAAVGAVLEGLVDQGVATGHSPGREAVYGIAPEQHLAAAWYRNSVAHFFLLGAVAELALLAAARGAPQDRLAAFETEALALRGLLEFDFYFPARVGFVDAVSAELEALAPGWHAGLEAGPAGAEAVLGRMSTLASDMLLRSFIEAYRVVVDALDTAPPGSDDEALLEASTGLGRQYLLQGRMHAPESVSRHLYRAGLQLVRHREADGRGPDRGARRRALASQLDDLLRRLGTVHRIAVRRVEQSLRADAGAGAGAVMPAIDPPRPAS